MPITSFREGTPHQLSATHTDVLFRVGREAIANVLRHAQASEMTMRLRYAPNAVYLRIEDNGVGMDPTPAAWGFGLRSMQQRCSSLGAELRLISGPDQGCTVEVYDPCGKREEWLQKVRRALLRTA